MSEEKKNDISVVVNEANTTPAPGDPLKDAKLKFPCEYAVCVTGVSAPEYKGEIFAILKKYVPELAENSLELSYSSSKKYCSVKARFTAKDEEQIDALYKELGAHKSVKWVL